MKKSRRAVYLVLCLVMILSILTACGGSTSTASPSAASSASTAPSTAPSSAPSSASSAAASAAGSPSAAAKPSASAAAAQNDPAASPPAGANFAKAMDVIIDNNKITVLNPFNASSNTSPTQWIFRMIYDTLVLGNGDGTYSPSLAASWETTDWQNITLHLRKDATFHNGEKFTAADVIYTIQTAQAATGTQARDRWSDIQSFTATDDYTLKLVLKAVNVDFLYNISQPMTGIVNKKAIDADPDKGLWVGTGCWKVTEFATNDHVKLTRNDKYWGQKAFTQDINLRFVPEQSTRTMMLQNGETDVCFSINPNDMPTFDKDTKNFVTYRFTYNNLDMIGFNMKDPICGDLNFRLAVVSALKLNDITKAACGDYGISETSGTFWGYQTEFRKDDIPIVKYDLEAAKKYLAASPYKGETIELATAISTNITASEVVQQQLSLIGIKIKIKQMDPPAMTAYCKYGENKSQMMVYVEPQTLSAYSIRNAYYPGAAYNRFSYENPDVTKILDKVPTIADINQRKQAYQELQTLVAKNPPAFNLFWLVNEACCVKGVGGMKLWADSYFDLRYIYKVVK